MVGIDGYRIVVEHLAVELAHAAAAHRRHLLHAAHVFILRDGHRSVGGRHRFERYVIEYLLVGRELALEHRAHDILLLGTERHAHARLLVDKPLGHIGIDTHETAPFLLVLVPAHEVVVELSVHEQDIVPLLLGSPDEAVLADRIVRINIYHRTVPVGLVLLHLVAVLGQGEVTARRILEQHESLGLLGELLVGHDAVFDEDFQVVPLALEIRPRGIEELLQLVGHLTGDVARYLAHVAVALKVAARHVQRNVRRIDNPVQQRQELGNDALHRIGHVHLVAVKLYPILLNLEIVVDFREIENPRQVERIVDVEMYPEQRVVAARIELPVEFPVLFVGHIGRIMRPERVGIVHDVVPFGIHILSVLPLLYLSAGYRYGKEAAVFTQHSANTGLVGELGALFAQIEDDIGSPRPFFRPFRHGEFGRSAAAPHDRRRLLPVRLGNDFHLVGYHEGRIEPQAEVSDDILVLVFRHELLGT